MQRTEVIAFAKKKEAKRFNKKCHNNYQILSSRCMTLVQEFQKKIKIQNEVIVLFDCTLLNVSPPHSKLTSA